MDIIRHKATTRDLPPPDNWQPDIDGECEPLPVVEQIDEYDNPVMVSFWKPSSQELDDLVNGHAIALIIHAATPDEHPVVAISTSAAPIKDIQDV